MHLNSMVRPMSSKYTTVWRVYILALLAIIAAAVFFANWVDDPFVQLGSVETQRWLVLWWWVPTFGLLQVAALIGLGLILFDPFHRLWTRIAWAIILLFLPIFLPVYWLVRVESRRPNDSMKGNMSPYG